MGFQVRSLDATFSCTSETPNSRNIFQKDRGAGGSGVLRSTNIPTLTKLLLQVMQRTGNRCADYNCCSCREERGQLSHRPPRGDRRCPLTMRMKLRGTAEQRDSAAFGGKAGLQVCGGGALAE